MTLKTTTWDAADYLADKESIAAYLVRYWKTAIRN
jgi:hypothetical protein